MAMAYFKQNYIKIYKPLTERRKPKSEVIVFRINVILLSHAQTRIVCQAITNGGLVSNKYPNFKCRESIIVVCEADLEILMLSVDPDVVC